MLVLSRGSSSNKNISQGYVVPQGDMLMLSPFWAHRNPTYFPDPDTYNPVSKTNTVMILSFRTDMPGETV